MSNTRSSVGHCSLCGKQVIRTARSAAAIICRSCRRNPGDVKQCARCQAQQPLEDFSLVIARGKQRRHSWCRECRRAYTSVSYYANHAARRAAAKAKYWADPEAARIKSRNRPADTYKAARLRRYRLTVAEYEAMAEAQDHRCAICQRQEPFGSSRPRLCVDHDHENGQVRGLLCLSCNTALGALHEDPRLFAAAVRYLTAATPDVRVTSGQSAEAIR